MTGKKCATYLEAFNYLYSGTFLYNFNIILYVVFKCGLNYRMFANESIPMKSLNHHVFLKYKTMEIQFFISHLRLNVNFSYNL